MISPAFRGLHVHLMGIGGAGVSALVPLLERAGAAVSGCDSGVNGTITRLRSAGVPIHVGHAASHLDGVDLLVHTAAVGVDHPEIVSALARGIPVLSRGECLVKLMQGSRTVAVSGSHGKTSTTWMIGHLLTVAGADPVVMVGGAVGALGGSGGRAGAGDLFIAETDESDGSFAGVAPEIAVVTNLDHEHLRHYGSFSALEDAFAAWLARVPISGAVIVPTTGLNARVLAGVRAPLLRCGLDAGDYHAVDLELTADGSYMRVIAPDGDLGEVWVPLPGAHMAHNALMAIAAARQVQTAITVQSLARCERVRRRFTVHGSPNGVRVVEDYGHHPTEVAVTIAAAKLGGGRVHVLFQPHRYTRTADCFAGFTGAFDAADSVTLLPIYAASETPIPGVSARVLVEAIAARRGERWATVAHADDVDEAVNLLAPRAEPGDTVLVLGAGDVNQAIGPLLDFFHAAGPQPAAVATKSPAAAESRTAAEQREVVHA